MVGSGSLFVTVEPAFGVEHPTSKSNHENSTKALLPILELRSLAIIASCE